MKNFTRLIVAMLLFVSFGCCCNSPPPSASAPAPLVTCRHPEFTPQSLTMIRQGMAVQEVERLFGPPDRSHEREKGLKRMLVYEYDMTVDPHFSRQYDVANTFYFGVDQAYPYLTQWEVESVCPAPRYVQ